MNLHAPYKFKQAPDLEIVAGLAAGQVAGTLYEPLASSIYALRKYLAETRKILRGCTALASAGPGAVSWTVDDGFRSAHEVDRTALLKELARMSAHLTECEAARDELQREACYPIEARRCPRCHYSTEAAAVPWSPDEVMVLRHMTGSMVCSGVGALLPA